MHIKALSSIRCNKVESPNSSVPLTWLPFLCLVFPDIVLWEIDVKVFMGRDISSIGLKVGHELGPGSTSIMEDILRKGLIIEQDQLLIRKMDRGQPLLAPDLMSLQIAS